MPWDVFDRYLRTWSPTRAKGRALIAINEGVIAAEVKEVSRSDTNGIAERRNASKACLRSGDRRLQQGSITKAFGSAKLSDGFGMDLQYNFDREMQAMIGVGLHASRFIVFAYRFIVSLMRAVMSSGGGSCAIGVMVMVPPAWTSTFTSSPTFIRTNWRSAESKMIPWELPIFEMVLIMCKTMYYRPICQSAS